MDDKIVNAIRLAKESLQGLELDDIEKQVALSKAIDYFLAEEKPTNKGTKGATKKQEPQNLPNKKSVTEQNFWTELEKISGIESAKLKDIYSIKGEQICLVLTKIKGSSGSEQQSNLSLLVIYAYTNGLGMEWVPSGFLVESAKDSGIYDKEFSRNLEKYENLFRKNGFRRGVKYKLSAPGIAAAKSYLGSL